MINDLRLESEQLDKLVKARIEFNQIIANSPLMKDDESNRGKFLSLESLQEKTNEVMIPLGLYIDQTTICENGSEYMVTTLHHVSGQFIRSIGWLYKEENEMSTDLAKEFGAIMTYKQRYQWRSVLGVGRGSEDADKVQSTRTKKQPYVQQPAKEPFAVQPKPVVQQQKSVLKISKEQKNNIVTLTNRHDGLLEALCKNMKVNTIDELEEQNYKVALDTADKMVNMLGKG